MTQMIAIVGAGLAGISAARTLRGEGYGGELVLIGDESCRPYDRPSLSKSSRANACNLVPTEYRVMSERAPWPSFRRMVMA